jgi:1-acyl-sn-glycerol-3-phosphate acyltransferase
MHFLLKILQKTYFVYAFAFFLIVMFLLFPFVIIASFFGPVTGGNFTYKLCMIWSDICFPVSFIFPRRIYLAPHDKTKPCIFVLNHISYLDAGLLVKAIRQPLRILAKAEMIRIPIFGFIYKNAVVPVERNNLKNRVESVKIVKSYIAKGISMLFFPEGTFNMTSEPLKEFYNGAFRVAIETQTPIKPLLFLDTFDRMPRGNFFSLTPGKCRIIYLDEISVGGLTIKDVDLLKEKVFALMSEKLREYKVNWIKQPFVKDER